MELREITQDREPLSPREIDVASRISQGKVTKEIADELFISEETAKTHSKNIRKKWNARNIADITRIFILEIEPYLLPVIVMAFIYLLAIARYPELHQLVKTSLIDLFK